MIFNSNAFLVFFAVCTVLYWVVRDSAPWRNALIFAASVFFYGWWDWRFVGLLLMTGGIDFIAAQRIEDGADPATRRRWLWLSISSNLCCLGFFKYAGFFLESASLALASIGLPSSLPVLKIILPAGISFYTFQALGYAIDVYRKTMKAERDPVRYFAFLTFFPQLVAGPIERASFLMPQFVTPRKVTATLVQQGIWLMAWGFFMKVVVADYMGPLVDLVFQNQGHWAGGVIWGTVAFAGQIYCDFSGYSAIARGVANTFGFELSPNFAQPYLAPNIQEFWRRWHMTLSTWFRDYVYIPLGGDRLGSFRTFFNVFLTFTIAGLWHGANWTFVFWGMWHGLALGLYRIWQGIRPAGLKRLPGVVAWPMTAAVVAVGWLFFRASSLGQVREMLEAFGTGTPPIWAATYARAVAIGIVTVLLADLFNSRFPWSRVMHWPLAVRAGIQGVLLACILTRWGKQASPFIYFQF